jgi:hypothetical protein
MQQITHLFAAAFTLALVGSPAPLRHYTPAPPAAPVVSNVTVTLREWGIMVTPKSIPAGWTLVRVINVGKMEHELDIASDSLGVEIEGDEIQPGGAETLRVNLQPGTWTLECSLVTRAANGEHDRRGMRNVLVVR